MDWNLAIEKYREALKRILVMLVAMVEVAGERPATLPRHLHRFVLRLLRPAEAAARRLIIVAARGLVVDLPTPRPHKPRQEPIRNRSNGFGTGILIRPGPLPEWAQKLAPRRSANMSLPLFDPHKRFGFRRRYVRPAAMPRIWCLDDPHVTFFHTPQAQVPPPPSLDDPLDAGRLTRRLDAIGRALDDLPHQAQRLARWRARRDAALAQTGGSGVQPARLIRRIEPMRPGRPPGWRRRPSHKVDEVLNELHGLALWARELPDTS